MSPLSWLLSTRPAQVSLLPKGEDNSANIWTLHLVVRERNSIDRWWFLKGFTHLQHLFTVLYKKMLEREGLFSVYLHGMWGFASPGHAMRPLRHSMQFALPCPFIPPPYKHASPLGTWAWDPSGCSCLHEPCRCSWSTRGIWRLWPEFWKGRPLQTCVSVLSHWEPLDHTWKGGNSEHRLEVPTGHWQQAGSTSPPPGASPGMDCIPRTPSSDAPVSMNNTNMLEYLYSIKSCGHLTRECFNF